MYKSVFFLFTMICICFAVDSGTADKEAIESIYKNRIELANFYNSCNYVFLGKNKPCNFSGKKDFLFIVNEPLPIWEKNKKTIFKAFLSSCGIVGWYDKNNSFAINNDLFLSILINLVRCNSTDSKSYSDQALEILMNQTSMHLLKNNSAKIKDALQLNSLYSSKKIQLLSLLELTTEEKESLLKNQNVSLETRARLGDKLAEDTIINKFINEQNYKMKSNYVRDLIYIGSDHCIKKLIIHFNKPVFNIIKNSATDSCVSESIRYQILIGFRQLFPENDIFNKKLQKFNPYYYGFNKSDEVNLYLKEFKSWAKNTYGVEPIDPDPMPILKGFCKL